MTSLAPFFAAAMLTAPAPVSSEVDPEEIVRRFRAAVVEELPGFVIPCEKSMTAVAEPAGVILVCVRCWQPFEEFVSAWEGELEALPEAWEVETILPWQLGPTVKTAQYTVDGVPMVPMFFESEGSFELVLHFTGSKLWRAGRRTTFDLFEALRHGPDVPPPESPERPTGSDEQVYIAGVGNVTNPRRIDPAALPVYPGEAREERVEGRVILQAVIGEDGRVREVSLIHCNRPDLGFEEAAAAAVRQWTYEPATLDGQAVAVYFTVVVDFSLK